MDDGTNSWTNIMRRPVLFSKTTKCKTLEIQYSPSLEDTGWIESEVDDETILRWFDTDPPCVDGNSSEIPILRLRLIIATATWEDEDVIQQVTISMTQDIFTSLQKRLCLPDYFLPMITSYHTRGFKYYAPSSHTSSNQASFLLKIPYYRTEFIQLVIQHDVRTNVSTGLVLIRCSDFDIRQDIQNGIASMGNPGAHPLLLPLVFLDREARWLTDRLRNHHADLDALATGAGQYKYTDVPLPDPSEADFVSVIRYLTYSGHELSSDVVRISGVVSALEEVCRWGQSLEVDRSLYNPNFGHDKTPAILNTRIDYLKNTCHILLLEGQCERNRIQDLGQAVYQFMAAKDAKTNLQLAETSAIIAKASKEDSAVMRAIAIESKRDSSAMKTISILGMVFLPGTFVAGIFAMPVFNWDGSDAPTIKTGFKYYWAVTIPLTVLVLTTWALGMLIPWGGWMKRPGSLKTRRERRDVESS